MRTADSMITTNKEMGRVYTPSYIVNTILDLSGYHGKAILKKHVIDNSCGDGAFLCEIVRRYCAVSISRNICSSDIKSDLESFIHGIEIDKQELNKCVANLNAVVSEYGIEGCVNWDLICGDALETDRFDGKMDYVLGNPPYVRVHNLGQSFNSIKRFSYAQNGMTDLFIVFFEIGIRMLSDKGTLGYISPSSYFNSVAGFYMRKEFVLNNLIDKIVNLKHYQAFNATAYTAITILKKNRDINEIEYYQFDENNKMPYYVDTLDNTNYYVAGNFYFARKDELSILSRIMNNTYSCGVEVKNGYATLCDNVFINNFDFDSKFIIPVIKSSKGEMTKAFFPYSTKGVLLSEDIIKSDDKMYAYLLSNKDKLMKRSVERGSSKHWYAFGRSQAIVDTFRDKIAFNSLLRDEADIKFANAPAGTGVYGGLYLINNGVPAEKIYKELKSKEFISYIMLLGKYKSGGYYTFSSKDVKNYLDYKLAYQGGSLLC